MNIFEINFQGYWSDPDRVPAESGICCLYSRSNSASREFETSLSLVHIVALQNAQRGLRARADELIASGKYGEQICFNFAPVPPPARPGVEAALIFEHRPPESVQLAAAISDAIFIRTAGANGCLKSEFVIVGEKMSRSLKRIESMGNASILQRGRRKSETRAVLEWA